MDRKYLDHLNPKKIVCFKDNTNYKQTEERKLNLIDWISPVLVKEFGTDLIIKAIINLNLVFQYITTYKTTTSLNINNLKYISKIYHISHITNESKIIDKNQVSYNEYHLVVPSDIKDGDIIHFCLLNNFPILKKFKTKISKKIELLPIQNNFVILKNIPEELKKLTINEILETKQSIIFKKLKSDVICYKCYEKDFNKYEFYIEINNLTLYVPYLAFKNKDFSLIEKRNIEYWNEYYNCNGYHNSNSKKKQEQINLLKSDTALKIKKYLTNEYERNKI